jgi:branched-chain amino acid transport system substrate-binding protein
VFFNDAAPKAAAQAIRKVADLGWKPAHYLANVAASVASTLKPAGLDNRQGGIITRPTSRIRPTRIGANAPDFLEWKAWMEKYMAAGQPVGRVLHLCLLGVVHDAPRADPVRRRAARARIS